ncbi:hypothetical protein [Amycolatopsis jejuensis]|uniref:hypothetical protein n=1 Tax=Amycolatopsis jejuensis TaxID=330084 RepID=UPI00052448FC|nr:hypothetical protein [Amycolatopsis jejuensis]
MSIQEQAQQLGALAEQVPSGQAQGLISDLQNLQQQVESIMGATGGAQEIQGVINAAIQQIDAIGQALEQVKATITQRAQYHQQG